MGLEKLKHLMKIRGLNAEDLSKISKVPKSSIDKIIGGFNKNPGYNTIVAISHALSLTLDELVDLLDLDYAYKSTNKSVITKYNLLSEKSRDLIDYLMDYLLQVEKQEQQKKKSAQKKPTIQEILDSDEPELLAAHGSEGMDAEELKTLRNDAQRLKRIAEEKRKKDD